MQLDYFLSFKIPLNVSPSRLIRSIFIVSYIILRFAGSNLVKEYLYLKTKYHVKMVICKKATRTKCKILLKELLQN